MKQLVIIIIVALFLTACVPNKQIERLGIITTYGVDFSDKEDDMIDSTILYSQFDPQAPQPMETVESQAKTYQDSISKANLKTSFDLVSGHMRMKLFGRELAEAGIMRMLSTHMRDAEEPANIYLAVSDTTAKEVLTGKGAVDMSKFLHELIENNIKAEVLPKSNYLDFAHKLDDIGIDPIQPIIKLEQERPTIDSIGVFQDDRLVSSLTPEQTFLVKLLIEKFRAGRREISLPRELFEDKIDKDNDKHNKDNIMLVLSEIKSKSDIKLEEKEPVKYQVNLMLESRMMEVSEPLRISDKKIKIEVEKRVAKQLEQQLEQLLKKLQEVNSDPIGFGQVYNTETRNNQLTDEKWRELYPDIEVNFSVDINLIRHGIIE